MIELRSDTFTLPTDDMRRAMITAALGDDVYGEDPTTAELERRAAEQIGQEAACLMPSGTMANLCALLAHAPRGSAVLAGHLSDIHHFEAGGISVLGGAVLRPVRNLPDGTLDPDELRAELSLDRSDPQFALPSTICLETTHNMCGGVPLEIGYLKAVRGLTDRESLALHLDGARVFNAALALGVPVSDIGREAHSVQFCLSKGLGAPIGSVVAGSTGFVDRVRRLRKLLGGGMRQTGVLAAAGLVALDTAEERLTADHRHARRFAELISAAPGVEVLAPPRTNIVFFRVFDGGCHDRFLLRCERRGVAVAELGARRVRAVFHHGVSGADVEAAAAVVAAVVAELGDQADRADGMLGDAGGDTGEQVPASSPG